MYRKKLMERREELMEQMTAIRAGAEAENRAFTEDEDKQFKEAEAEVNRIDASIRAIDAQRDLQQRAAEPAPAEPAEPQETQEQVEIRAFANIVRNRADENVTKTANGAIIPTTIANRIIDRVKDISPLFGRAEKYNIKGNVAIPYVDKASDNITVAYADEFTDLESKATGLKTIELTGYLTGALAKVSKSLLNATDLDLVNFVIDKIAVSVATFLDTAILVGDDKIAGLKNAEQTVVIADTIAADTLIEMQGTLKSAFQTNAIWVMAPATLIVIRKLKDGNGRYLFNDDIVNGFSGTILGKPVYTSDQAPALGEDGSVVYLDPAQALAAKTVEDSVQVLQERFATQHALGIVAWMEADAKIQNQQAVVRSTKTAKTA